ncbi:hypothetical protein M6B38_354645 [Iris pallida]|uniref:Uncharacterized protein n=1 Tax=Iris pallida TaxID=29817 RepID=A0AAX6GQA6_IRIPA|nr:hypothetical protein M6B38_354645 [Iris pallida]
MTRVAQICQFESDLVAGDLVTTSGGFGRRCASGQVRLEEDGKSTPLVRSSVEVVACSSGSWWLFFVLDRLYPVGEA